MVENSKRKSSPGEFHMLKGTEWREGYIRAAIKDAG